MRKHISIQKRSTYYKHHLSGFRTCKKECIQIVEKEIFETLGLNQRATIDIHSVKKVP